MTNLIGRSFRHAKLLWRGDVDLRFLPRVRGVIHVGANVGQERFLYDDYGLEVLWVEPLPEVFALLKQNLAAFPRQRALQYLVTDRDDATYTFHVSNNVGASSSILELGLHRDLWPDVRFDRTMALQSVTLDSLVRRERIDSSRYDALVMDTQGSELLVLHGATALLPAIRYVKLEAVDFELYAGGCRLDEVAAYLDRCGFRELARRRFARHPSGGGVYDIVYERSA